MLRTEEVHEKGKFGCPSLEEFNMIEYDEFCAMLWTMSEVNQPSGTLFCGAFGADGIPKFIRRVLLQDIYPALYFRNLQQVFFVVHMKTLRLLAE